MREVSKQEYVANIKDYENPMLLTIENGTPFLRSDIETTGDGDVRIELMDFKLNTKLPLNEANTECRSHYAGHITFIEYPSLNKAIRNVVKDFINLDNQVAYIICRNCELEEIAMKYPNQNVYIQIE